MKTGLHTNNIWNEITKLVKSSKTKSYVAVAYFGTGAAEMLPISKGSKLVVDASENAIRSGQTNPNELLKLSKTGVEIYSWQNLHAKMFVIGKYLLVGSTNVSKNSELNYQEAIFVSNDKVQKEKAKDFICNICLNDIGEKTLRLLCKKYNPAKGGVGRVKSAISSVFTVNIKDDYYSDYEESILKSEKAIAVKKINKSQHYLHSFMWNFPNPFDIGSKIIQVYETDNKTYVYPTGNVCRIKSLNNGYCFVFIEVPRNVKPKTIRYFDKSIQNRLKRNGRISQSNVDKINLILRSK